MIHDVTQKFMKERKLMQSTYSKKEKALHLRIMRLETQLKESESDDGEKCKVAT